MHKYLYRGECECACFCFCLTLSVCVSANDVVNDKFSDWIAAYVAAYAEDTANETRFKIVSFSIIFIFSSRLFCLLSSRLNWTEWETCERKHITKYEQRRVNALRIVDSTVLFPERFATSFLLLWMFVAYSFTLRVARFRSASLLMITAHNGWHSVLIFFFFRILRRLIVRTSIRIYGLQTSFDLVHWWLKHDRRHDHFS